MFKIPMFAIAFIAAMSGIIQFHSDYTITRVNMNPTLDRILMLEGCATLEANHLLAAYLNQHIVKNKHLTVNDKHKLVKASYRLLEKLNKYAPGYKTAKADFAVIKGIRNAGI